MPAHRYTILMLCLSVLFSASAVAEEVEGEAQAEAAPEAPKTITVDREAGVIDIKAKLVTTQPQWLELVATTAGPKGRAHEAIVTIDTKPSRIHLALVTLGLKPGKPLTNTLKGEEVHTEPAKGPAVELFFVYEKDEQTHEVPVHTWVADAKTDKPIAACKWLFTGSVFRQWEDREYYMADEAGTIVSLVHFGDDLIARQTDTTKDTDFQQLKLIEEVPLELGDELVLRIKVPKTKPDQGQPGPDEPESDPESPETSDNPPRMNPDQHARRATKPFDNPPAFHDNTRSFLNSI